MQMQVTRSSNIRAAGYENGVMRVQFHNGTMYDYQGVSAETFAEFMASESQGKYYHKHIKSKFSGAKVVKEDSDA